MPSKLDILSVAPEQISAAIEKRQAELGRALSAAERELYYALLPGIVEQMDFGKDGKLRRTAKNYTRVSTVDKVFDSWADITGKALIADFISDLLAIAGMVAAMYADDADADVLNGISDDNALILAVLGIAAGEAIRGGLMWEIWRANRVRQDMKDTLLGSIKSGLTLSELTKAVRDFSVGDGDGGRITRYWRTYAYDLFNQVSEIKNEQFRAALDLHWLIYVGDVIQDSRDFCVKKAGKVFADVEADKEWPKDPDLIGKGSGIPYTPRIDRGRWNCRHRIRYITRELALQLDKKKVEAITEKYGGSGI